jgi:uncharacterized protein (DUF952 family)
MGFQRSFTIPSRQGGDVETIGYKILRAEEFAALQADAFEGAAIDQADGYVHLSTADQVAETASKHFAGQSGLMIAAVDLAALGDALRWEVSRGGALFPHLYGQLRLATVRGVAPLAWRADGTLALP